MTKFEITEMGSSYSILFSNRDDRKSPQILIFDDSFEFEYFKNKVNDYFKRKISPSKTIPVNEVFTGLYVGGSYDGKKLDTYSEPIKSIEEHIVPCLPDWKAIAERKGIDDEGCELKTEKYKKMRIRSEDTIYILEIESSMTEKQVIEALINGYNKR